MVACSLFFLPIDIGQCFKNLKKVQFWGYHAPYCWIERPGYVNCRVRSKGFWRVRSSVLLDEPGFERNYSSVFSFLGLVLIHPQLNKGSARNESKPPGSSNKTELLQHFFSISKAHYAIEMGNSFFQRKISAVPTGGVGN